jgi:DNA invertase Pin-like site-specific DNA recombinase
VCKVQPKFNVLFAKEAGVVSGLFSFSRTHPFFQARRRTRFIAFHIEIGTQCNRLDGMKAYALDLRDRVVKFIQGGGSKAEAARRFALARSSVYRYLIAANKSYETPVA